MPSDMWGNEYEEDNIKYTGLCMWDSGVDCPHCTDCEDSPWKMIK